MKKNYNKIINQIEKIRSKNNINWMNLLRLAFKIDPKSACSASRFDGCLSKDIFVVLISFTDI